MTATQYHRQCEIYKNQLEKWNNQINQAEEATLIKIYGDHKPKARCLPGWTLEYWVIPSCP